MIFLPIVERELRAESRNRLNYWSRMAVVGTVMLLWGAFIAQYNGAPSTLGRTLLFLMHWCVLLSLVIFVPIGAADCLSREKREGTLGLLFLTPLTAEGVVMAKALLHAVRACSLLLVVVPLIAAPLLLGGIEWRQVTALVLVDFNVLLAALAGAILASAFSIRWQRSLLAAFALCLGSYILMSVCFTILMLCFVVPVMVTGFDWSIVRMMDVFLWGLMAFSFFNPDLSYELTRTSATIHDWYLVDLLIVTCFSLVGLVFILRTAARQIHQCWQEEPPTPRQMWWLKTFCTPQYWQAFFRRRMGQLLDQNPIQWLHDHSWSARLTKWGWSLGIVLAESIAAGSFYDISSLTYAQCYFAGLLAFGMAFSAAGSFHQERQSGALELLLVTPITELQIVNGRIWCLWKQFALPGALILLSWTVSLSIYGYGWSRAHDFRLFFVLLMLALPVFGLFFALRCRTFFVALFWTCVVGILVPWFLILRITDYEEPVAFLSICFLGFGAWVSFNILCQSLRTRKFAFH